MTKTSSDNQENNQEKSLQNNEDAINNDNALNQEIEFINNINNKETISDINAENNLQEILQDELNRRNLINIQQELDNIASATAIIAQQKINEEKKIEKQENATKNLITNEQPQSDEADIVVIDKNVINIADNQQNKDFVIADVKLSDQINIQNSIAGNNFIQNNSKLQIKKDEATPNSIVNQDNNKTFSDNNIRIVDNLDAKILEQSKILKAENEIQSQEDQLQEDKYDKIISSKEIVIDNSNINQINIPNIATAKVFYINQEMQSLYIKGFNYFNDKVIFDLDPNFYYPGTFEILYKNGNTIIQQYNWQPNMGMLKVEIENIHPKLLSIYNFPSWNKPDYSHIYDIKNFIGYQNVINAIDNQVAINNNDIANGDDNKIITSKKIDIMLYGDGSYKINNDPTGNNDISKLDNSYQKSYQLIFNQNSAENKFILHDFHSQYDSLNILNLNPLFYHPRTFAIEKNDSDIEISYFPNPKMLKIIIENTNISDLKQSNFLMWDADSRPDIYKIEYINGFSDKMALEQSYYNSDFSIANDHDSYQEDVFEDYEINAINKHITELKQENIIQDDVPSDYQSGDLDYDDTEKDDEVDDTA